MPSFWQMECLENALFNDADLDPAAGSRERIAEQWRFITTRVPAFTPRVLAGDGRDVTINTTWRPPTPARSPGSPRRLPRSVRALPTAIPLAIR